MAKENPTNNKNTDLWNILENHGQINITTLKEQAVLYLGNESRRTQDDMMLYKCLFNSLTDTGRKKILIWKNEFMVTDEENSIVRQPYGILLLKVIICESHIDTNTTITSI